MTVLFVPVVLVAAGMVVGVLAVLRPASRHDTRLEANPMVARVAGEVHAGEEQVLIHLARTLEVATARTDVGYGDIYISGSSSTALRLASRSEIGRGFDGEVRVRRTRHGTTAEYFVLRMPGDEALHQRIRDLDGEIASALQALDPDAQVRVIQKAPARIRRSARGAAVDRRRSSSREDRAADGLT
jgi:hypothetical protein